MTPGWRSACAGIAVSFLLCAGAGAQASNRASGPDTVVQLHGTVLNGVTGKPIARALVVSGDQRIATLTDDNGQFAVDVSVPPQPAGSGNGPAAGLGGFGGFGRFQQIVNLTAKRPGFVTPAFQTNLMLDETLSSKSVELKLMPTASISGHVSAEATDAPEGVRVSLLRRQVNDGRRMWNFAGMHMSDSRGDFHFDNLEPGEYTLMTADWTGEQGETQSATANEKRAVERYAPVFYGDVSGLAEATKTNLHYGDAARAEIHLHKVRYFPVAIPVNQNGGRLGVGFSFAGTDSFKSFRMRYSSADGAVTGDLPDGSYTLQLSSNLATGEQQFAQVSLHVGGAAVRSAPATLMPLLKVEVRVHREFTTSQNRDVQTFTTSTPVLLNGRNGTNRNQAAPPLQIFLHSADEGVRFGGNAQGVSADEMVIENLRPGRYYVQAMPLGGGYVASMTSDGVDLLQQPLVVRAYGGAAPIDVTLRDDVATVNVNFSGDQPASDMSNMPSTVSLYFLPDSGAGAHAQMSFAMTGKFANGSTIAPGSYHVLAFQGPPQNFAFREPEVVQQYAGKGVAVTASAGQTVTVDVPVLDDPQTAEAP